jgi:uncharacterized membrane protein YqgA involved in biofilm formation
MIGTIVNAAAIVLGGLVGLAGTKTLSAGNQGRVKAVLGVLIIFFGLGLTWMSLNGSFVQVLKQIAVVVLALTIGKFLGRLLHLQKQSNRLGQFARDRIAELKLNDPNRFTTGFTVCAALFCAAPLGILGAIHEGLSGYFYPLVVKAIMDGLAAMSFVAMFGWGALLSAVPVFLLQGTISLACSRFLLPFLNAHHLADSVNATGGLLIFCVALIIFDIKKIEVTDYLPSLVFAPLLTWWLLR